MRTCFMMMMMMIIVIIIIIINIFFPFVWSLESAFWRETMECWYETG